MFKNKYPSKMMTALLIVTLLILIIPNFVAATTEQISQTTSNATSSWCWTFGQTFTPTKNGSIDSAVHNLVSTEPGGSTVVVEIHSLPIGPGSLLGTSASQLVAPATAADYTFTFATPVDVEAGETYALLAVSSVAWEGMNFAYQDADAYSGGNLIGFDGTNWQNAVTQDAYFIVSMTLATYDISYVAGTGGTITGTDAQTVDYGANTVAVTATPISGYHFVSWNDSNLNATRNETAVMADATYTASFAPNSYTITFDSAGGSPVTSITQDFGTTITAPADPTRTGYTFTGWTPALPATMPVDGAALTAQWTINQYTVTFLNWDNSVLSTQTIPYGGSATPPTAPARAGYTFVRWSTSVVNITGDVTALAEYQVDIPQTGENNSFGAGLVLLLTASGLNMVRIWLKRRRQVTEIM